MARAVAAIDEQDLERALLRKSVEALSSACHRCADCGRTPLTGETLHRYAGGVTVCELCRSMRGGAPEHSETVRHSEHGHTVRIHRIDGASSPTAVHK